MRVLLSLLLLLSACGGDGEPALADVTFTTPLGAATIRAEVARTQAEQARGLMLRDRLAQDRGMLFVFEGVAPRRFFMKDTLIPLDLVSIRARAVVAVQRMEPCTSDPCPITTTPPADAALEINAGRAEALGVVSGATVSSSALPDQ